MESILSLLFSAGVAGLGVRWLLKDERSRRKERLRHFNFSAAKARALPSGLAEAQGPKVVPRALPPGKAPSRGASGVAVT